MVRKVLDEDEIKDLTKKETIRYFMRIVEQEPEEHDRFFDYILENDYFKIKINLNRLLKLLKPLIDDKDTKISLLENEIFAVKEIAFVDITKGKEVAKDSGDLYIRTFFTPKHLEETKKNIITLYTNLFKVKLDPNNPIHLVFMKKMIDMRSSPILKYQQGNDREVDVKSFIEILKLTFNMKSTFDFDTIPEGGNVTQFDERTKRKAPSLSQQVTGASMTSMASSIRDEKSTFFMNVEKLGAKRYNFYGENINYFTFILLRETEQGLIVYEEWYEEFDIGGTYFRNDFYIDWKNFKRLLDKYVFDSVFEEILEVEVETDPDEKLPDVIHLYFQTFIPEKQKEDIQKGNILFLTPTFCLTLSLEDDMEFLEDLPLIYSKDITKKKEVKEYKALMKSLYSNDTQESDDDSGSDNELPDSAKRNKKIRSSSRSSSSRSSSSRSYNLTKNDEKILDKFLDFADENWEVVLEEQDEVTLEQLEDGDSAEIISKLIDIYSLINKDFKKLNKDEYFNNFIYRMINYYFFNGKNVDLIKGFYRIIYLNTSASSSYAMSSS